LKTKNKNGILSYSYYGAIILAVWIWASVFLVSKTALAYIGPITIATIRLLIAFVFLSPISIRNGFKFRELFSKQVLIYGTIGYGLHLIFFYNALAECSAAVASTISGLLPLYMMILGYAMLKEKIKTLRVVGSILSVVGVIIAAFAGVAGNVGTSILGVLLMAVSSLSWGFCSVYSKRYMKEMNTWVQTELMFGATLLLLIPMTFIEIYNLGIPEITTSGMLSLLYLGAIGSAGGIALWNYSLKGIEAGLAGVIFNFLPGVGVLLAYMVGEKTKLIQFVGCLLIVLGVIVTSKKEKVVIKMEEKSWTS